jgi:hypothetical protein
VFERNTRRVEGIDPLLKAEAAAVHLRPAGHP